MNKIFNSKKNIVLFLIILVALFLRLYKLSSLPPSLTPDEASLGYNAYSIFKTGKDEFGKVFPIVFKSFGDYKPGLYIYLTVPFVSVFGLNEWAVRALSAIAGVVAVWLIYSIVNLFLEYESGLSQQNWKESVLTNYKKIPYVSAFLLAVSPWHLQFSRGAWEANLSLTLTLAAIFFFLKFITSNKSFNIIFSAIFFSLTLIAYQGAKLSTLIVLFILFITFYKEILSHIKGYKKEILAAIIIGFIISTPILSNFSAKTGRLKVFSVFSYPRSEKDLQLFLDQGNEKVSSLSYYLFHSEKLNFARGIMGRWFNHVSGRFLFFEGDWSNAIHSPPNQGVMYICDIILIISGLVFLTNFKSSKFKLFVLSWLFLAPLPSALSRDQVHAVRSLNMVIPLMIISSFGVIYLYIVLKNMSNKLIRIFGVILISGLYFLSFIYYLDAYYIHLPRHNMEIWSYGYKQIVEKVTPLEDKYARIKIQQSYAQPYIYFLFYQKYDPAKYQEQAHLTQSENIGDVGYVEKLDKIYFSHLNWPQDKSEKGTLIVADSIVVQDSELKSNSIRVVDTIKYFNGDIAFRIIEVN